MIIYSDELEVYLRYVTKLASENNSISFYFWISSNLKQVATLYFEHLENVTILTVEDGFLEFPDCLYLYDKLMNNQVIGEYRIPEAQIKDTLSLFITNVYGGLFFGLYHRSHRFEKIN